MHRQSPSSGLEHLDLTLTEIAVIWMLHHRARPMAQASLTRQIVEFYPVAMNAISGADGLRGAKQVHLRLIYFKGLIVAQTHPMPQMVDAIRRAERLLGRATEPNSASEAAESSDQDTLAHIAGALR